MTEQSYQRKIVKELESRGAYVVKVITASKKGVPDILACYQGIMLAIEVKTPTTMANTSPLQKYNLAKIKEAGGYSLVAYDMEQVYPTLASIDALHLMSCMDAPVLEKR